MAGLIGWGRAARKTRKTIQEDTVVLSVAGREIPLRVRHNPRARRLTLRIDPARNGAVVTLPAATSLDEGLAFAKRKSGWLLDRLDRVPQPVPLIDGASVPFLGEPHRIRHTAGTRGLIRRTGGEIRVPGRAEHLPRRLIDWLKREARRELAERARILADRIGKRPGRISVRDTRSRWGSCSANGNLSFCWRLILAPEFVLDYVVAHEVAHLIERNHGPGFWKLVSELTDETDRARSWLRRNGDSLLRYG